MSQQLYTTTELAAMTSEELRTAQANGFVKPDPHDGPIMLEPGNRPSPDLPPQGTESDKDPYAVTSWAESEYDFRVPSGQLCRMKKLRPEEMIGTDLLDRVTRLPGFAEENIRKAEGRPPTAAMPSKEALAEVIEVLDELLPLVVVKPKLWPEPTPEQANDDPELDNSERRSGRVYVSDVELADRVAIMERAVGGVKRMDNFRKKP